jgi:Lon protease-like protein
MGEELGEFSGVVRLFPLPNLVLFPQVVQPLHIFEQRYREMTADALANDKLIAMALLQPGWEKDYEGRPPVHSVGCVGKIVADQRLEDGRYNLLLRGLGRVVILEEQPPDRLYRLARVRLLPDREPPPLELDQQLRNAVAESALAWLPQAPAIEQLQKLVDGNLPLGQFCDLLSFALPLPMEAKQALLEQASITERAGMLRGLLEETKPETPPEPEKPKRGPKKYPPEFSSN